MKIFIFRSDQGEILGVCDENNLEKYTKIIPYGIHSNESTNVTEFTLNSTLYSGIDVTEEIYK